MPDLLTKLLTKKAEITKRTLYAYFGNEEGLIEEVLNYRHPILITQYGCVFINAYAEYSDAEFSVHQIAKQHKSEIRQWLFDKFAQVSAENAKQKYDTLFVFGERITVGAQTVQESRELDTGFFEILD